MAHELRAEQAAKEQGAMANPDSRSPRHKRTLSSSSRKPFPVNPSGYVRGTSHERTWAWAYASASETFGRDP